HLAKKEYNRAIGFLDKALDMSDSAGLPDFKADVYLNLAQYHKAVGNIDRYNHFNDQYIKVVRSNVRNNRHFADNVIARTEDRLAALSQSKQSILLGALVLLALLVLGALFLWKGRGGRGARPKRPSEGEGGLLGPMDPSLGGHPGRSGDTAAQDRLMSEETE